MELIRGSRVGNNIIGPIEQGRRSSGNGIDYSSFWLQKGHVARCSISAHNLFSICRFKLICVIVTHNNVKFTRFLVYFVQEKGSVRRDDLSRDERKGTFLARCRICCQISSFTIIFVGWYGIASAKQGFKDVKIRSSLSRPLPPIHSNFTFVV